eukprot:1157418-Pelagomonas_calceolata.AAC.2
MSATHVQKACLAPWEDQHKQHPVMGLLEQASAILQNSSCSCLLAGAGDSDREDTQTWEGHAIWVPTSSSLPNTCCSTTPGSTPPPPTPPTHLEPTTPASTPAVLDRPSRTPAYLHAPTAHKTLSMPVTLLTQQHTNDRGQGIGERRARARSRAS